MSSNYIDLELEESAEQTGLFSGADNQDIETLQRSINVLNFNLLCSRVCFKDYKQQMQQSEAECH